MSVDYDLIHERSVYSVGRDGRALGSIELVGGFGDCLWRVVGSKALYEEQADAIRALEEMREVGR